MERLTICDGNEIYFNCEEKVDITEKEMKHLMLKRLARYEDAEEQGRLIILPHKIGDRVFLAQRGKVRELEIKNVTCNVYYTQDVENGYRDVDIYPNDFGRYVFHSREEAEKALEAKEKT